jgi:hypothetical protein
MDVPEFPPRIPVPEFQNALINLFDRALPHIELEEREELKQSAELAYPEAVPSR